MTCTPDQFIVADDNITALRELFFLNVQPVKQITWQSQVYLEEERSYRAITSSQTLKGYLSQTVGTESLKTVLCSPGKR
jgi:hypothetical protein